ncbi:SpoIVB peptidase [Bariatricus sp. HCP28S3_A7]|uniref:SpoIVB peptidase n=1 Tax=Bariatricus sp. HCP28S3_A7 TaxID=3438894 RepID=UPI003F890712
MTVRWYRRMLIILLVFAVTVGGSYCFLQIKREELKKEVSAGTGSENLLIPGGMPIGIYMETDGVMVLGTDEIKSSDGSSTSPAKHLVKDGDYIVGIDEEEVENKQELIEVMQNLSKKTVILHLRRKMEYIDVKIHPAKDEEGKYKLGIWVRDNVQGLGTITFLNANSEFGALGHGIHDVDTSELLEISEGTLYETSIQNIKKGQNGCPGGMEGIIVYNHYNVLGSITSNTETGIYGKIDRVDKVFKNQEAYPAASKEEIKTGKAYIRCAVSGEVKDYEIQITKIDLHPGEVNKGIEIRVTDEELLRITGGIVQGMSGSPILQDGKIVGAVTHVFVQDSTKGYGIFIENMLENLDE